MFGIDDMLFLMEKTFLILLLTIFLFFSCATSDENSMADESVVPAGAPVVIVEPVTDESAELSVFEEPPVVVIIDEPDVVIPVEDACESVPVIEEPAEPEPEPEPEPVAEEIDDEYHRSISSLSGDEAFYISPEVFEEDKNQIFKVINDLDRVMKKKDFDSWLTYLTPESAEYWSNRHNLLELSRHMFSGGDFHINNIREYFELFFIPARRGRLVDEIRYVTPDYVKVVQYKNKTDVIYYFFEKQDGEWKLKLDTLNN